FAPQRHYVVTGWIKGDDIQPGAGAMLARLYIGKEGGGTFKVSRTFSGTFDWSYIEIGPFPVEERTWVTLIPYLHQSTGTVWFDDLRLREVTAADLARLAQQRARDRALDDLAAVQAAAQQLGAEALLPDLAALRERLVVAEDLPTSLDARRGPPYFPLHAEVFGLMARVNRAAWGKTVPTVCARWADPYSDVTPLLACGPAKRGQQMVQLLRGETEPTCLRLTNLTETTQCVEVSLAGRLPLEAFTWRLLHYVPTADGLIIGDPLVKVGSGAGPVEVELTPGLTQDLWLMIDAAAQRPARHRMEVSVEAAGTRFSLPLTVHIHDIGLPDELAIHTFAYDYTTWDLVKDRIPQSRADLRAHRINTYVIHGVFTPWPTFTEAGEWQGLDWTGLDAQIELHPGAKCFLLWPGMEIGDRVNQVAPKGGPAYPSAEWRAHVERWAKELAEGMAERGFGYDHWALYIVDEPSGDRAELAAIVGELVHAADPRIRIFENPYGAATPADMELMAPVVDIWCPSLDTAKDERLAFCRETAEEVWMYQVLGKSSSPLRAFRLAFWEAFVKDLRGFGFWDYADCGGSVWDPWDADRHDYAVVYDGDETELIPSKRWEAYRDGAEDHALLTLLAAQPGWDRQRASDLARQAVEAADAATLAAVRRQALTGLTRD
ncbi:MAG: DUF4091 domain-containing protein, partial [Armatimonadetes bacterium]|nr:DUF4091 domain-containing protein [Armatimonadota bacterium]